MVKHIHSTPLGTPKTPVPTERFANLKSPDATDLQAVQKILALFNYLYKIPLASVAELSTKDVCVICKGDTDIGFPMCETARSRVRLANCGHILCLGCLSRSAFSFRGNRCPHCQEKLVQDGQGTCCEDDDTVNLVRFVEYLKGIGPETARVASKDIFATCHSASSRNSRKSVIIGAYWVAVAGDVTGGGVDRVKFRRMIRYALFCTVAVLCTSLAFRGLMVPFSKGSYSLTILVLLMYVFGIRLSFVALKVWWFLSLTRRH
ncbi:hypothetical protein JMJ35_010488 [Cladonia borealis]|uniref:RING-type domain-containing protein n=1 Tax=Cladonia borealis TaxID=184061 RepID=A0AA39V5W7_9LECA|nr:hypothetical protein JMJ35_010488 [Cladonia borealis]